jgi:ribosome-interacting GTPase 1
MTEPSKDELLARIAELERQARQKKSGGAVSFKVSDKGAVSVYGLGRFPVTLYYEQWQRLLGAAEELRAFLEENKSRLKLKDREPI